MVGGIGAATLVGHPDARTDRRPDHDRGAPRLNASHQPAEGELLTGRRPARGDDAVLEEPRARRAHLEVQPHDRRLRRRHRRGRIRRGVLGQAGRRLQVRRIVGRGRGRPRHRANVRGQGRARQAREDPPGSRVADLEPLDAHGERRVVGQHHLIDDVEATVGGLHRRRAGQHGRRDRSEVEPVHARPAPHGAVRRSRRYRSP
jgi:hypothetical protein